MNLLTASAAIVSAASWDPDRYPALLLQSFGETLFMVALTMLFGGIGGLILGVALYATRGNHIFVGSRSNAVVNTLVNVLVNIIRPIPFILLIFTFAPLTSLIVGTSIGTTAAVVPLSIAVTFGFARIVEQNLVTIQPGVIEAARAAGAGPWRIIFTLLVPEALGPLILGYTFVFVAIVDMTAVAGAVGAGGLGSFALQYGYRRWDFATLWIAVIIIIALVQLGQFVGNRLAKRVLRR